MSKLNDVSGIFKIVVKYNSHNRQNFWAGGLAK